MRFDWNGGCFKTLRSPPGSASPSHFVGLEVLSRLRERTNEAIFRRYAGITDARDHDHLEVIGVCAHWPLTWSSIGMRPWAIKFISFLVPPGRSPDGLTLPQSYLRKVQWFKNQKKYTLQVIQSAPFIP